MGIMPVNSISIVPEDVTGAPNVNNPFVVDKPTLVTVPEPAGDAHTPSPRQYVALDALRPPAKLLTGKFPVTCDARLTGLDVIVVPSNCNTPALDIPATFCNLLLSVKTKLPAPVIGLPLIDKPVEDVVAPTLVTVPLPGVPPLPFNGI
jgi:hypothetical protein